MSVTSIRIGAHPARTREGRGNAVLTPRQFLQTPHDQGKKPKFVELNSEFRAGRANACCDISPVLVANDTPQRPLKVAVTHVGDRKQKECKRPVRAIVEAVCGLASVRQGPSW